MIIKLNFVACIFVVNLWAINGNKTMTFLWLSCAVVNGFLLFTKEK